MDRLDKNPAINDVLVAVQAILNESWDSGRFGDWKAGGTFEPNCLGRSKGGIEYTLTNPKKVSKLSSN